MKIVHIEGHVQRSFDDDAIMDQFWLAAYKDPEYDGFEVKVIGRVV